MKKHKKIVGKLFLGLMIMMHLSTFFHSFFHHNSTKVTSSKDIVKVSDSENECSFCYLNLNNLYTNIDKQQYFINTFYQRLNVYYINSHFTTSFIGAENSRAPPFYL